MQRPRNSTPEAHCRLSVVLRATHSSSFNFPRVVDTPARFALHHRLTYTFALATWLYTSHADFLHFKMFPRGPRFSPGPGYERRRARDEMRPPVLGGRSKRDQLGSWAESWGQPAHLTPVGLHQHEVDPPSRSTSPFKTDEPFRIDEPVDIKRSDGTHRTASNPQVDRSQAPSTFDRPTAPATGKDESAATPDLLTARLKALRLARNGTNYEGCEGPIDRRGTYATPSPRATLPRWKSDIWETRPPSRFVQPGKLGHSGDRGDVDPDDESLFAGSKFRRETDESSPIYAHKVDQYDPDMARCISPLNEAARPSSPQPPRILSTNVPTESPSRRGRYADERPLRYPTYSQSRYSDARSMQRAPSSLAVGEYPRWSDLNDPAPNHGPMSYWAPSTARPSPEDGWEEATSRTTVAAPPVSQFREPSTALSTTPSAIVPGLNVARHSDRNGHQVQRGREPLTSVGDVGELTSASMVRRR